MKNLIKPVLILIAVLITITGAEKVIYTQQGKDVTLIMPSESTQMYRYWHFGSEDSIRLAWFNTLNGKGINADSAWREQLSLTDNSLIIKNLRDANFGTFLLVVKNNGQKVIHTYKYKLIKLSVNIDPDAPLLPGEVLSLGCNVNTPPGQEVPDIHWLNPHGERVKNDNRRAILQTVSSRDNGSWTCVVENTKIAEKSVTVLDLSPGSLHRYTSVNSILSLPCSIPSYLTWEQIKQKGIQEVQWHFSPQPSTSLPSGERQRLFSLSLKSPLTWVGDQDKGLRPDGDPTKGSLSLIRSRVTEEDRGDFTCSLTFQNGVTLNSTVHVQVLHILSSAGTEILSGQRVNLSCSTGEPLASDMQLKWLTPEKSSVPRSDLHAALLTIKEAGGGDSGKWRCELWRSSERLTSAAILLKIEPTQNAWMLAITGSVAVIVLLLLLILTFILCRRRQRKTRHSRHRLCHCKNPKPKGFYRT